MTTHRQGERTGMKKGYTAEDWSIDGPSLEDFTKLRRQRDELLKALKRAEPALWIVATSGNKDAIEIHAEALVAIARGSA